MHYSIDLLKGQGIPARSRPEGIIATAITAVVPLVIALSIIGLYFSTKVVIEVHKTEIANCQRRIEEFSSQMIDYKSRSSLKADYEGCLSETSIALGKHNQWSDILVAVVENLPDSLVLNKLSVQENKVRVKVPDKNNPGEKIEKIVPSRTLSMKLEGPSSDDTDKAVKKFRKRLQLSSVLGPKLEDIPVSQEVDVEDGHNVISYELKCIFKPQI